MTTEDHPLALRRATKTYPAPAGRLSILDGIDLTVHRGEVVCVLGPSGCGKTTLLRVLAGLERLDGGLALADGAEITGPDPRRALVFQDFALFPWLSVADNVAFGPRVRRAAEADVHGLLGLVGLTGFEHARPRALSGGMAQRVALARALANDPEAILFDEPLGALDLQTRLELQDVVERILTTKRLSALVVTHDLDEALVLGDRVVVLTRRPARISREIEVALPRPRDRASLAFAAVRTELAGAVRDAFALAVAA